MFRAEFALSRLGNTAYLDYDDLVTEGQFMVTSRRCKPEFLSWSRPPDNFKGAQHCASYDVNNEWDDNFCDLSQYVICQDKKFDPDLCKLFV